MCKTFLASSRILAYLGAKRATCNQRFALRRQVAQSDC